MSLTCRNTLFLSLTNLVHKVPAIGSNTRSKLSESGAAWPRLCIFQGMQASVLLVFTDMMDTASHIATVREGKDVFQAGSSKDWSTWSIDCHWSSTDTCRLDVFLFWLELGISLPLSVCGLRSHKLEICRSPLWIPGSRGGPDWAFDTVMFVPVCTYLIYLDKYIVCTCLYCFICAS